MQSDYLSNVLWSIYCRYTYINHSTQKKECFRYSYSEHNKRIRESYIIDYPVRSNEQWDFIHSHYFYLVNELGVYKGSLDDFINYLEPYGCDHKEVRRLYKGYNFFRNKERFRKKKKFQQKGFKKKEEGKTPWKCFKSKTEYRLFKRKKTYLKKGIRAERRSIRNELKKRNWENESSWDDFLIKGKKRFVDPWDWD